MEEYHSLQTFVFPFYNTLFYYYLQYINITLFYYYLQYININLTKQNYKIEGQL